MKRGLLLALGVALAWCALIFSLHVASPRTRLSAHGLLHVAIAESCQRSPAGSLFAPTPPDDPLFAGAPLPYYFFFHRVALALAAALDVDVARAFELLLLLSAAVTVVVGWIVGRRLFESDAAGLTTSFLLFAGAHPQGPLVLLVRRLHDGPGLFHDDGGYLWGLVHPLNGALRIGDFYGTLGPLISTFMNLTARPLALALLLVVVLLLDVAAARPSPLRIAGLALATLLCTLFNPIVGLAAAGALGGGLLWVAAARRATEEKGLTLRRAAALALALVVGAALAWPWCRSMADSMAGGLATSQRFARDEAHLQLTFSVHRAVAMATGAWLIALLAWFGRRRLDGARRGLALALIAAAGVLSLATALVALPVGNEDNLFHAALVLLSVPAAGIVVPLAKAGATPTDRSLSSRSRALLVHAAFAPIAACVLFAYVGRPALPIAFTPAGLERLPADGDLARLYAWLRANTPADAVVVQDPGPEGRTCAGNTSELPALTGRSLFTDYARHYLVAPFRAAPLRAAITAKLTVGAPLEDFERAHLRALGRPIFVVTYDASDEASAAAARRDAAPGAPLFRAGSICVRRFEVNSAVATQRKELARAALAFGLLFGLAEGALLIGMQESGRSRWPIALGVGPAVPFHSAAVDGALAVAIALVVAGIAAAVASWRERASGLLVVLLTAGGAYLGARINDSIAPSRAALIAAGVALAIGLLAWRSADRIVRALGRVAMPASIAVGLVAAALELGPRWRDARARAPLPPPPAGAKSVLVVVWDTVRPDHLSAYGCARKTSPRLEALAAEGARFDSAFATSSWTLPSHASMLTGRLPREHGAGFEPLDATWPTLGEEFAARGWRCGAFSGNLCYFTRRNGFGRGFATFDDVDFSVASRLLRTLAGRELFGLADPARANDSEWLRRDAADVNRALLGWLDRAPGRPFFAFLNYFDAHAPYRPPAATRGRFGDDDAARYDECIAACDARFGELIDALARRGRLDDTVVVVLSDHGESFGENGARFHRGSLQREQTQVAWIVRAPGRIAPATVVASVASLCSLPATLLQLANSGGAGPFPAESLVARMVESRDPIGGGDEGEAIGELARHPWPEYRDKPCFSGALRSIVKGRWHLVHHSTLGIALFDRIADPREEHDLHGERPALANALARELDETLAHAAAHADPDADDPELAARGDLAGLGYVAGEER